MTSQALSQAWLLINLFFWENLSFSILTTVSIVMEAVESKALFAKAIHQQNPSKRRHSLSVSLSPSLSTAAPAPVSACTPAISISLHIYLSIYVSMYYLSIYPLHCNPPEVQGLCLRPYTCCIPSTSPENQTIFEELNYTASFSTCLKTKVQDTERQPVAS